MPKYFLDTGFAIALASRRDQHHERAVELAADVRSNYTHLAAVRLIASLRSDSTVEVLTIDDELFDKSFALYSNRDDKEWGLTDCMSFVVMDTREITDALTPDEHFNQAGFNALMRT